MVRGHQGVDPKQTSSPGLPGIQMWPRCPQQPFPQGGTPAILCSSFQPFSQGQGRKTGDLQCSFPIQLLEESGSLTLSFLPRVTWVHLQGSQGVQPVV